MSANSERSWKYLILSFMAETWEGSRYRFNFIQRFGMTAGRRINWTHALAVSFFFLVIGAISHQTECNVEMGISSSMKCRMDAKTYRQR